MKKLILPILAAFTLQSCASGPVYPDSPLAKVGKDFEVAAAQALQAYAEYKNGNADITWALQKMFLAYQDYKQSSGDVKALIKAWAGTDADGKELADRLARIFGRSPIDPPTKMAALAQISQKVAEKH